LRRKEKKKKKEGEEVQIFIKKSDVGMSGEGGKRGKKGRGEYFPNSL